MSSEGDVRAALTRYSGLDFEHVPREADLIDHFGLDSLTSLRLLAVVEKRFGVRFPDERLHEFRTLDAILRLLAATNEPRG